MRASPLQAGAPEDWSDIQKHERGVPVGRHIYCSGEASLHAQRSLSVR
jgi:hypothetical protein